MVLWYRFSLASQTQPTRRDTESDPRWGWLGLACETTTLAALAGEMADI